VINKNQGGQSENIGWRNAFLAERALQLDH